MGRLLTDANNKIIAVKKNIKNLKIFFTFKPQRNILADHSKEI
jgi:hypothetical protein